MLDLRETVDPMTLILALGNPKSSGSEAGYGMCVSERVGEQPVLTAVLLPIHGHSCGKGGPPDVSNEGTEVTNEKYAKGFVERSLAGHLNRELNASIVKMPAWVSQSRVPEYP